MLCTQVLTAAFKLSLFVCIGYMFSFFHLIAQGSGTPASLPTELFVFLALLVSTAWAREATLIVVGSCLLLLFNKIFLVFDLLYIVKHAASVCVYNALGKSGLSCCIFVPWHQYQRGTDRHALYPFVPKTARTCAACKDHRTWCSFVWWRVFRAYPEYVFGSPHLDSIHC